MTTTLKYSIAILLCIIGLVIVLIPEIKQFIKRVLPIVSAVLLTALFFYSVTLFILNS